MKTWDFKQVQVIFGGNLLTGFVADGAITGDPSADDFTLQNGAYGETSRSKNNNGSWIFKLKFMQTATANDILSSIRLSDKLSNAGVKPFLIKDNNGSTLVAERQAFISKAPSIGMGAEAGDREWTLILPNPEVVIGGNNE